MENIEKLFKFIEELGLNHLDRPILEFSRQDQQPYSITLKLQLPENEIQRKTREKNKILLKEKFFPKT